VICCADAANVDTANNSKATIFFIVNLHVKSIYNNSSILLLQLCDSVVFIFVRL
jgi:hypothetical protein